MRAALRPRRENRPLSEAERHLDLWEPQDHLVEALQPVSKKRQPARVSTGERSNARRKRCAAQQVTGKITRVGDRRRRRPAPSAPASAHALSVLVLREGLDGSHDAVVELPLLRRHRLGMRATHLTVSSDVKHGHFLFAWWARLRGALSPPCARVTLLRRVSLFQEESKSASSTAPLATPASPPHDSPSRSRYPPVRGALGWCRSWARRGPVSPL